MNSTPHPKRLAAFLMALAAGTGLSGCSFVLDKDSNQCTTNADCEGYGIHPYCQQGVCVPSGLGPEGCFFGQPTTQQDFATQCSTSGWIAFDNCDRLGLCDGGDGLDSGIFLLDATPQDAGSAPVSTSLEGVPAGLCTDLAGPNIIYVTGSTNMPPLIAAVQPVLYSGSPSYTIVWASQTSCAGAGAMYNTASPTAHLIFNTTNNWAFFYNQDGEQITCLLDDAGDPVDVGESDVYPEACGYQSANFTNMVAQYEGPVQAITFVVNAASDQTAISAEAAHFVFGNGGIDASGYPVLPWTDPTYYYTRSKGTGTTIIPSFAIGVAPNAFWGIDRSSASNLTTQLETPPPGDAGEEAIGVLSDDYADRNRGDLRELAFQQAGESVGYLPDSTTQSTGVQSYDKQNVRDGHYPIWGKIHLFANLVGGTQPSAPASALLDALTTPKLDQTVLASVAAAGFIPNCAMHVSRTQEMGPMASVQPAPECTCFFLSIATQDQTPPGCTPCQINSDCPSSSPVCNYNFCETQ